MDSVMLGSLTFYMRLVHEYLFSYPSARGLSSAKSLLSENRLLMLGHALADVMAAFTVTLAVSFPHRMLRSLLFLMARALKVYCARILLNQIICYRYRRMALNIQSSRFQ